MIFVLYKNIIKPSRETKRKAKKSAQLLRKSWEDDNEGADKVSKVFKETVQV